jgi:Zn-finger nucleic acid-binding protein
MGPVEAQACPRCDGLFLEQGQLNQVTEPIPGDLEFSTVDLDTFQHEDTYPPATCPHCRLAMDKVEFNIDSNLILDYCRHCQGFWLDGAELDAINQEVRRLNTTAAEIHDPPWLWLVKALYTVAR